MEKRTNYFHLPKMLVATMLLASVGSAYAAPGNEASQPELGVELASPQQAKVTIKGTVSDAMGPIIGASVLEKGTTNGVITDIDGNFTLSVSPKSTIVVSYIGYVTQELPVGAKRDFTISLKEDSQALEEVVVVGYGTQKKINLTGSLANVSADQLEARPVTNVSQALAGLASGVSVRSNNNQPGNDNASIIVRGRGTLNTSGPLIVIDGIESGINTVVPSDIESMTVLKDAASSAIYGSRAANGVVLITTKKGKAGTLKVNYDGYVSFVSRANDKIEFVTNSATYMEYLNEGYINSGSSPVFAQSTIDAFRADNGAHPDVYANSNVFDAAFKNSVANNHNISMSGGTEKIRFYGSFGYSDRPGIMDNAGYKQYNARVSVDADVKSWLSVGVAADGYVGDFEAAANNMSNLWSYLPATSPTVNFIATDGTFGYLTAPEELAAAGNNNPARMLWQTERQNRKNHFRTRFFGTLKPFKGFSITASYNYELTDQQQKSKPNYVDTWYFDLDGNKTLATTTKPVSTVNESVSQSNSKTARYAGDIVARYENKFFDKQLDFAIMAGASQELYRSESFSASKKGILDHSLFAIGACSGDASASGSSSEYAMRSYFGRLNLGWADKYLAEFNLRADGSSRFNKDGRWGYFPSGSLGWRIDQEGFMEDFKEKARLDNLKFRVSYGALGNNSIGNYAALSLYNSSAAINYVLNNTLATGIAMTSLANTAVTWEKTAVFDFGIDFGFFGNRLNGTIDYYNKNTTDILMSIPAPRVHGTAGIGASNYGTMNNQGIEVTLGWQDRVNDFTYSINGNFTWNRNRVTKYKGNDLQAGLSGANLVCEGYAYNTQYGWKVDRIIQTDEDMQIVNDMIANAPFVEDKDGNPTTTRVNPFALTGKPQKGDLLYKDLDGNGVIDLKDKTVLGNGPDPKFYAGLNIALGYKGWDFSALIQGQFGANQYWQNDYLNTSSVRQGYQIPKKVAEGAWREGMTDAKYTRLMNYNSHPQNKQVSDFYLQSLSFVKLRNVQLGYTFPKKWFKGQVEKLRIYGSLENFLTLTSFDGFDPETVSLTYPTMKSAVVGLNVTF